MNKNKELELPRVPESQRRGRVGESIASILFSSFATIPWVNETDIGIDIYCELLVDEKPTARFFLVQVKYYRDNPPIKQSTKNYWSKLEHPVFVLWIKNETNPEKITLEAATGDKKFIKQFPSRFEANGDKKFIQYIESDFLQRINKYWDEKEKTTQSVVNARKSPKVDNASSVKVVKNQKNGFKISEFLNKLTDKIANKREIDDFDKIRLYLFAAAQLYRQNIPSEILGNHEINLIYTQRAKVKLTGYELILILRTVLSDQYHLKAGWYWLKRFGKGDIIIFLHHFILRDTSEDVVVGSLSLLSNFWEDKYLELLGGSERLLNENIKIKELEILKNNPSQKALDYCKRYLEDESERVKDKVNEVYAKLLSIFAPEEAVNYLSSSNSTHYSIDSAFYTKLSNTDLRRLQNIKDNYAKVDVVKNLVTRSALNEDELLELIKDEDWNIRFLAIKGLITKGFTPTAEQIRTILWSKGNAVLTALSRRIFEFDDKELIISTYLKETTDNLKNKLEWNYFGDEIYEAIGKKDKQFIDEVRVDLINGFKNRKRILISKIAKVKGVSPEFLESLNSKYEKSILSQFNVAGLKIILEGGSHKDKHLAYKFLNDESVEIQDIAKKILLKYADSEDISVLLELSKKDYTSKFLEKALDLSKDKQKLIEQLIKSPESRIVIIGISFANRNKVRISNQTLTDLLNNKDDSVRKYSVVYMISNLPPKEYTEMINQYTQFGNYFYNVISLFDLLNYSQPFLRKIFLLKFLQELDKK